MHVARRATIALHRARFATMLPFAAPRLFRRLYEAPFYRGMHESWLDALAPAPGTRVLEVGCGPGGFASTLASRGLEVQGVDRSAAMVESARRSVSAPLARPVFTVGSVERLPIADAHMDLSVASSLINVVADPAAALREMMRVTRPGGRISVLFPGPGFGPRNAIAFGDRLGLTVADAALLELWASAARSVPPDRVQSWFESLGMHSTVQAALLEGLMHTVTGTI